MNQLKELSFINSATLPFAQIDVAENTLFSGGNGAGKTTILRAILYFYGAGRSEHLGISRKKKRFEEYYFKAINSYLVYRFENEHANVLAIVYKAGGLRVKYRFAIERNKEEIKELFFESNRALEPKELWTRLLEKEYELSPILNSPKEYRSVLYAQDKKLSHFSFFAANSEYEQISKTLSNVFINSKLDSGSIKKSLVSSISGFEPIDLNQMRRNIEAFRVQYDDISAFSKNAGVINEAVNRLGIYEEQNTQLLKLAQQLGANTKEADAQLERLKEEFSEVNTQLSRLEKGYQKAQTEHKQAHDEQIKEEGVLERAIEEAKAKEAEYSRLEIDKKLVLWEKKPLLEDEIVALQSQLSALMASQGDLSQKFEQMRQKELKSLQDKQIKLRSNMTGIEETFNSKNASLLQEEQERISHYRHEQDEASENLSKRLLDAKEELLSARSQEEIIHNKSFDTHKIEKAKQAHHKALRECDTQSAQLELMRSQQQKKAEQIYSAEQSKEYQLQTLQHEHEKQTRTLSAEIEALLQKQKVNEGSVLGFMRAQDFQNTTLLTALLKDEVLYAQDLKPSLAQSNETLLGLKLDTSAMDLSAYESSAIAISLQASQDRLKRMNEAYEAEKESLENETRNAINALRREQGVLTTQIDALLRTLPRLEQESLSLAEELQGLQNLAAKQKDEALVEVKALKQAKEQAYQRLQEEQKAFKQTLQEELVQIKEKVLQKREAARKQKEEALASKQDELQSIKAECDKRLEEIKRQEQEALIKGGVDPQLLKKYQNKLQDKEKELAEIVRFEDLIREYKIDEKRIFSHLEEKKEALDKLKEEIKAAKEGFATLTKEFEANKKELSEALQRHNKKIDSLKKDLKEYLEFKNSSLYTQWAQEIEQSEYEVNEANLSEMINKLRDLGYEHAASKDRLRKGLNKAFASISLHNIFNLYAPSSDTDEAILASANALKTFVLEDKIQTYKEEVAKEFSMTIRHLSSETSELLKAEGDISKTVSRINKTLQDLQGIKVIRAIELRYKESDNLLLNVLKAIASLVEEHPYGSEINLFSEQESELFNAQALKYLEELALHLSEEKSDALTLDESFVLEFRAVENGNDTGFVPSLDGIGSNGTDVMVKAMVNIAMLSLARKQSSKKEASVYFHCILDEVGILSPAYLKELIAYANNKKIRFVNGAPDEKLVSTYKRLYMLSTNARHETIVRKLVSQS